MLVSSETMLKAFENLPEGKIKKELVAWFTRLVNVQTPNTKPDIRLIEEEKVVLLYCSDPLWLIVNKWKMKDLKSMGFLDFVKLWKEIKPIMEKGE
jgi:hypothetical protein